MTKMFSNEDLEEIEALVPVRDKNGGNFTKVYLVTGQEWIEPIRCKTCLSKLAKMVSFDLKSWRESASKIFAKKNELPAPLRSNFALIQVKVRNADYKDEGTIAFLNLKHIKDIYSLDNKSCRIFFTSGLELDLMESKYSVSCKKATAKYALDYQYGIFDDKVIS